MNKRIPEDRPGAVAAANKAGQIYLDIPMDLTALKDKIVLVTGAHLDSVVAFAG